MHVDVKHGPETVRTTMEEYQTVIAGLVAKYGPWAPGSGSAVEIVETVASPAPVNSTFDKLVTDETSGARVESLHAAAESAGYGNIRGKAWFADNTRMADSGYATERARDAAHAAKGNARDVLRDFAARIDAEKRVDRVVRARDVLPRLAMEKKLTFDGLRLQPRAVHGMLARLESPATRYVNGLRDRYKERHDPADRDMILSTLVRELESNPDVELNFRTRLGLGDIFATVGPGYGNADGNLVAPILADALPDGTKATVDYDEATTQWHVKASVRTSTDVNQRVISEPTENGLSFRSHDGGGSKLKGGDFLIYLLCLNASIDEVMGTECSLTHRARVLSGLRRMIPALMRGMAIMTAAWADAADETVQTDVRTDAGILIPLESVIPGFFRHMLTARKGELVGILPGRTETNVATLAKTFQTERRNPDAVTRSDLGQALTRTVRDLPDLTVRTDAQAAIGAWIHRREPIAYAAR